VAGASDLLAGGLAAQREGLDRGDATASELVEASLARIEATSSLAVVISTRGDAARAEAEAASKRIAAGEARSPLDGLPVLLKDNIVQTDEPDDWVVGTGEEHSVREFCEQAFGLVGVDLEWSGSGLDEVGRDRATGTKRVIVNSRYFRPAEVDRLLSDSAKIRRELGWKPRVGFQELVEMMVNADIEALGAK